MILKTTRSSLLTLVGLVFTTFGLMAQSNNVGIGTATPHQATLLDLDYDAGSNPARGIRIPYANTVQLNQLYSDYGGDVPNGLLIYETDLGKFVYYKWDSPSESVPVNGQWMELETNIQSQNTNVPTGGIIMWSGTISSIPPGWALCDGSAPSPYNIDLTDKFVVSVSSAQENPGTAAVNGFFVDVEAGNTVAPDRRFFKLAYIIKLP